MAILICFALKEEAAPFRKIAAGKTGITILLTGIGRQNGRRRAAFRPLRHRNASAETLAVRVGGTKAASTPRSASVALGVNFQPEFRNRKPALVAICRALAKNPHSLKGSQRSWPIRTLRLAMASAASPA